MKVPAPVKVQPKSETRSLAMHKAGGQIWIGEERQKEKEKPANAGNSRWPAEFRHSCSHSRLRCSPAASIATSQQRAAQPAGSYQRLQRAISIVEGHLVGAPAALLRRATDDVSPSSDSFCYYVCRHSHGGRKLVL